MNIVQRRVNFYAWFINISGFIVLKERFQGVGFKWKSIIASKNLLKYLKDK